jgi:hypothetical protein
MSTYIPRITQDYNSQTYIFLFPFARIDIGWKGFFIFKKEVSHV